MAHRDSENSSPSDSFRWISRIAQLVSQVSIGDIPDLIVLILEEVRKFSGLSRGAISLFDYISDEIYVLNDEGGLRRFPAHSKSEATRMDLPRGLPLGKEEIPSTGSRGEEFLVTVPVAIGAEKLGELCIVSPSGQICFSQEQQDYLKALTSLAAVSLDRGMRQLDSLRLREWLEAFSKVFAASQVPNSDRDSLLQAIGDNALKISRADFVVLYEYFEERNDVRLPPTLAGELWNESVLRGRSVAIEHRQSAVFRLLQRQAPFYAEHALRDWLEAGLIDSDPGERSFLRREGVASSAGIPLEIENERVGIIFVNYRREQMFSAEFRRHLELFANQAALLIGNARFLLRSERYSRDLEALNRIGRELGSAGTRDIEQIGRLIDEQTFTVIPTKNFFLCVYDVDRDRFSLPHVRDEYDTRESLEPRLHLGLTGYVCRTRRPLLATKERKKQLFDDGSAKPVGRPAEIWLGAPLVVRDQVIGAIVVQDYGDETALNGEHLHLLEAIASQAAIAIDNYRLLNEARLRLEELSALLELSQEFGARRLTSPQLLSTILDRLCKLALADGSLLLLVDQTNKERLKVVAASYNLQSYLGKPLALDEGLSGRVARTGQPAIINEYAGWSSRCQLFEPPPKRVCAVPLIWKGEVIGVMTLSSDSDYGKFSEREVEILQRFAGPAAVAIQNDRDSSLRRALIDAGPNAIVAVDSEGHIIEFNEEASSLFKYSKADVLGESVTKLYWGGFKGAIKIQEALLEKGKITAEEIFGRSSTDDKIPMSLAAALLKDDTDNIMGSVGILEDLRVQSLRGRTQLLFDALRQISDEDDLDLIIEIVVLSSVTLLYADAGCAFVRSGSSFELKYSYPRRDGVDAVLSEAGVSLLNSLATAGAWSIVLFPDEDSDTIGLHILPDARSSVLVPVHTDERLLGFILIESHQTNHFNADQDLLTILASQAAVSINRLQLLRYREETRQNLLVSANAIAVGQIATSFMHEAKNSLNGMQLAILSLSEDIEAHSPSEKKGYLDRLESIRLELERFDDLSRRLQRFTQQGLRPEKVESYINEIVEKTLDLLGSALRSKRMRCETRLDPSLGRPSRGRGNPVLVDANQIQQVLMNLILNAVAASPERRPLVIETRNSPAQVEIRVIDHGTGISKEVMRKLFRPFVTTKRGGVGLGLFLSRLLVEENHQGSIEVTNNAPKGATFSVRLPRVI